MNWDVSMQGFLDELQKIADVSLSGLSPETVLNAPRPEPMVTTGLDKARAILAKAEMLKTAGRKKPKPIMEGYGLPSVNPTHPPVHRNAWDTAKPAAGHTLAGMGAGRMLSEFRPGGASPRAKFIGMAAGGALGATDYAYQKLRARQPVKTAAATPAMALKASQQVGKVTRARSLGATLKKFTPTIGRRGTIPTP